MAVKKNTLLIVAGSLLILLLIGVTILLISEKQTNKELVMEFNLDKEDLENQYTDFARQYDELKLTVSNDSLSVLLEQEQLKTQRLLEELRTVKSSNATEIRRLKKELASLRKVMIGYINQIDSLNRLTAQQKEIHSRCHQEVQRRFPANQQLVRREEEPDQDRDTCRPTGRHQHLCAAHKQTRQDCQEGERHREVQNKLLHREKHHCRDRRTYPLHPHHQTGQ